MLEAVKAPKWLTVVQVGICERDTTGFIQIYSRVSLGLFKAKT